MNERYLFMIVDLEDGVEVRRIYTTMNDAKEEILAHCYAYKRNYELRVVNMELERVERLGYSVWNAREDTAEITLDWKPLTREEARSCNECQWMEYPACDKGIPCCKCSEECNSRQRCKKGQQGKRMHNDDISMK